MNGKLKISAIVRDAGGQIVGRTRLQKVAYLLVVTGLESNLAFSYKHYGPYSEDVAVAARREQLLGHLSEIEQTAHWGGSYSVYSVETDATIQSSSIRKSFTETAAKANAVELELAATAVFLAKEGYSDPWAETEARKPEKSENGHIAGARRLLERLRSIQTPVPLPPI